MKIRSHTANLLYLFLLWCVTYLILSWTYGNFHWIKPCPRDLPEVTFSNYAMLTLLLVLGVEFTLNFPAKHWYLRLLAALVSLFLMGTCLPTF